VHGGSVSDQLFFLSGFLQFQSLILLCGMQHLFKEYKERFKMYEVDHLSASEFINRAKQLARHGASFSGGPFDKTTPLHLAVKLPRLEVAKEVVRFLVVTIGVDIGRKDAKGRTAADLTLERDEIRRILDQSQIKVL
jgi:hypothetical protein